VASYVLFAVAGVMMIYGVVKPQMDYSDAFKEPSDGPSYRAELEKRHTFAEKYKREHEWKSRVILAMSLVLLIVGLILRD
jgi:hypothetical protein